MANKRKRRKKRKITRKGLWVTVFFIVCIIVSGIFFYYLYNHISGSSSTVYEEVSKGSSDLNAKISNIDHRIYETLYREKISENDIYFTEVTQRTSRDYQWDFTEVTIRIPDRETALSLADVLKKELFSLRPDVDIYRDDITGQEITYNVFSLDLYTHKIRLVFKEGWERPYKELPRLALVIDDIGNDYQLACAFMDLGLPITFSVLPSSVFGKRIAEKARKEGIELLLHLPMEPKNYPEVNPGTDALLTRMDQREILAIMDENLKKIPGISGVNNHMGSYFTESEEKMSYVLKELKKRKLFYLDSRTTSNSVGFKLAEKLGVLAAEKDVFLDNDLSAKAVKYQVERLIGKARYSGEAIGIGHPHEVTLEVLKDYAGILKKEFKLVPVSELAE